MIAAGVGCRREITADEIENAVRMALGLYGLAAERLEIVATETGKAADPAFPEAARRLSATLRACSTEELDGVAGRILTPSMLVLQRKGVPSIAEGAALDFGASPAVADGKLFLRSQTHLYCISEKK